MSHLQKRRFVRRVWGWLFKQKSHGNIAVGPITSTLEPDLPWYLNRDEYGGKPVLTLGAHNIKFPYLERSEYGEGTLENGDVFLKNTFGSIYNGIASTWNDGMAGKEGSAIMFEGDSDMESTVRHIMRGKYNAMELEGLAGMIIIHETTVRGSNKLRPYEKTEGDITSYVGDHTSFDTDINGNIYKYETYEKTKTGYFNPTIRFDGGQKDGTLGAPHINKKTKQSVTTPHIQTKKETRKPTSDELPRNSRF